MFHLTEGMASDICLPKEVIVKPSMCISDMKIEALCENISAVPQPFGRKLLHWNSKMVLIQFFILLLNLKTAILKYVKKKERHS